MDPVTSEQLDYGDEEYGGSQKMQYHQGGAIPIPALAEEEMIPEDDDYDDLYNDVNVGEGFLQMQRSEPQMPSNAAGNGGFQASKTNVPTTRGEAIAPQEVNNARAATQGNYAPAEAQFPEPKSGLPANVGPAQIAGPTHTPHSGALGFQGSVPMPHKPTPLPNTNVGGSNGGPQIPPNLMNSGANVNNRSADDEYQIRPNVANGNTMLFVGELHWWTTDAELESVLFQYGKVKEVKFFEERASGKSKGYCQVEFYESAAAAACKEGMHGHVFNGRPCVVAFATAQTIRQMGASYTNKTQAQAQAQPQGRNNNDGAGRGNGTNFQTGDNTGRNFGRGGWAGRGGNQVANRGPGAGPPMRGRGAMGPKNMLGNAPGAGAYGPAFGGPPGLMHPQGMMGPGFDLAFMGRGVGYGGFSGPAFPGMIPPFPAVNSMGLPGVAPHVNPAFFGRGMAPNMMGTAGMDGPHSGMWGGDANMGGWGPEEYGRGTRESSYGGEDNTSEYGEASHDKGAARSREKERISERDWSSTPDKRHREERDYDGEKYERNREEKDRYRDHRHKDRDLGYDEDWDRGHASGSRVSRSRAAPADNRRSRSREKEYGKRRRVPSE